MRDPEFVFQRFQDSINPETAFEAARITDIYRSRIESNPLSFRKFCKKYHNYSHFKKASIIDHGFFYLSCYHYEKLVDG